MRHLIAKTIYLNCTKLLKLDKMTNVSKDIIELLNRLPKTKRENWCIRTATYNSINDNYP